MPVIWLHENNGRVTTGFAGQGNIKVILALAYFELRIAYLPQVAVLFGAVVCDVELTTTAACLRGRSCCGHEKSRIVDNVWLSRPYYKILRPLAWCSFCFLLSFVCLEFCVFGSEISSRHVSDLVSLTKFPST